MAEKNTKNIDVCIRKTEKKDMSALMEIFSEARRTIAALGIDQWQNGYPNEEVITDDIERGYSYCAEIKGENVEEKICATFALIDDGEIYYDFIKDGDWQNDSGLSVIGKNVTYLAIHRVAISVFCRGTGMSTRIIEFATDFVKKHNKNSLRIDTHKGNVVMRRMLEKHGFVHCGTVFLDNGDPRVAYEKII